MNSERMSFDEACRELGVTEAELENLVAAGEIASLKEGDTLFFKKEVVRKFKKSRESEPTILLADEELNLLDSGEEIDLLAVDEEGTTPTKTAPTDKVGGKKEAGARIELSLDEELEVETRKEGGKTEVVAGKTKEIKMQKKKPAPEESSDETLLSLDGLLEDDSEGTTPIPAAAVDDSTLLDTDLLDLGGGETDPFSSDTVEETAVDLTEQGTLLRGGGARVMQMKRKESHAAWTVVLALAAVILILPLGVLTGLIFAQSPQAVTKVAPESKAKQAPSWIEDYNFLQGPVEMLADFFRGK